MPTRNTTGTIAQEILRNSHSTIVSGNPRRAGKIRRWHDGASWVNNTYALVMRSSEAQRLGVRTIGDLRKHPELKMGSPMNFLTARTAGVRCASATGFLNKSALGLIMRSVMPHWPTAQLT